MGESQRAISRPTIRLRYADCVALMTGVSEVVSNPGGSLHGNDGSFLSMKYIGADVSALTM